MSSRPGRSLEEQVARREYLVRRIANYSGFPASILLDIELSTAQFSSEANGDTGFRVRERSTSNPTTLFVVRNGGDFHILGEPGIPEGVARTVLSELDRGELAQARKWLDWLREEIKPAGGDDVLAGPLFPKLWSKGQQGDDKATRLAAASLLATSPDAPEVISYLRPLAQSADAPETTRMAYLWACVNAKEWPDALPVAQKLAADHPDSTVANDAVVRALLNTRRGAEAEGFAKAWVARDADSVDAKRVLGLALDGLKKFAESEQMYRQLAESAAGTSVDWNSFGWTALVAGDLDPQKLEAVERGASSTNQMFPAFMHTLASMDAELGNATKAREEILGTMNGFGLQQPDSNSWYVLGRLAEQFGVGEAALADYRRVEAPAGTEDVATSTYALAQRRIAALKKNGAILNIGFVSQNR